MVAEILIKEITNNIGNIIIFWVQHLRFEGKVLDCDDVFLKYYDSRKEKIRYVRIEDINSMEVKE